MLFNALEAQFDRGLFWFSGRGGFDVDDAQASRMPPRPAHGFVTAF